ncbi:MAG: PQQ-binding-like beta-propeller repeat protein [Aridibacter famidurans]|nr:PQQ-binding-like beta-propeller repeat protein [Aridibacter famidurans]
MRSAVWVSITIFLASAFGLTVPASAQTDSLWSRPLETCWVFDSASMTRIPPASDNTTTIFLPQTPARLVALSLLTGDIFWTVETSGELMLPPLQNGSKVTIHSSILAEDGRRTFRSASIDPLSGVSFSGPLIEGGRSAETEAYGTGLLLLVGSNVLRLADESGIRWERELTEGGLSGIYRSGMDVFAWSAKGDVYLLDGETGATTLRFKLPSEPSGAFAVLDAEIYAGSSAGTVYSVDRESGEIGWSSRTGGTIDKLVAEDEGVLVTSRDNFVYFLSDGNGSRIWKRKLAGRIVGSAKVGDGFYAFAAYGSTELLVLNIEDGRALNSYRVEGAEYFAAPPVNAGSYLLVPFDSGLAVLAPKGLCQTKKDGK